MIGEAKNKCSFNVGKRYKNMITLGWFPEQKTQHSVWRGTLDPQVPVGGNNLIMFINNSGKYFLWLSENFAFFPFTVYQEFL